MLRKTRHEKLLSVLGAEGVLPVGEIARRMGVSEATARRDLDALDQAGQLTRVYGGAVASGRVGDERPFGEATVDDLADKAAVAHRAAELVADGDVVLLDIGTTTLQLAKLLRGRDVTVVTSNLAVFDELRDDPAVTLILLGGQVRRNYRSLVGFLTESNLRQLHVGRLFLGASGVLPDGGVLDSTQVEVPIKRAMLSAAREVVLLVTVGKFPGETGLARVCGPRDINTLITNDTSDPATLAVFREADVEVLTV
ncbi:DeoR/GlpR family DNA-binding transcription regulator [Streptomyces zagrosensis]|uniref:DeoR/GlpR family transcriptional regulator of sugar metabolism n=1 Tax=Streptomyces zagrosensis TaxID=1042984 RepID=A0A7W9V2I6_9ACTN|nr:DeoR/GlpR family DNA-binding transcription regulator [Streptomyces zagrosensis]MBB5940368.1 DeoR/GlpR family transcriptional regulator of sugar metabolism [Streptomyces zagrosensis]